MSTDQPPIHSHSAEVRMSLIVGDRTLEVAKASRSQIMLRHPTHLEPCDAELVITIDGKPRRWLIHLPCGAMPDDLLVSIEDLVAQPTVSPAVAVSTAQSGGR